MAPISECGSGRCGLVPILQLLLILILSFLSVLLGAYSRLTFCVFVAGWRHALRSAWPFVIMIIYITCSVALGAKALNLQIRHWLEVCSSE